jgi:hypothetical protein
MDSRNKISVERERRTESKTRSNRKRGAVSKGARRRGGSERAKERGSEGVKV